MTTLYPTRLHLNGHDGLRLTADGWGDPSNPGVLLAHGGGQTRHAWGKTARNIAASGWYAVSLDQRGHGDSDWSPDGRYGHDDMALDLVSVAKAGFDRAPVLVGASMGGIGGLIAQQMTDQSAFAAIVLVDITHRWTQQGVENILNFMRANSEDGFASIEAAAEAVGRYLPHRKDPPSVEGLKKNLRRRSDGRWYWHWDPRILEERDRLVDAMGDVMAQLEEAATNLSVPTLLVRGGSSEVVTEAEARAFLKLVPHAEHVDVSGAHHMVAGDRNDVFSDAVLGFLNQRLAV